MKHTPTKTIGFILPNASNYFGHTLIEAFSRELDNHGYKLITALANHSIDSEKSYLKYMAEATDGIMIISDAEHYDMIEEAIPTDIPTIFLNRKPMECPHTSIIENDYAAVFQAVFSLINYGHENIACVCRNPDFSTTKEILRAYQTAMENSPAGYHEEWVHFFDRSTKDLSEIVDEMTELGCTAFFAASQTLTERLLDYLYIYNTQSDKPIELTGFANIDGNNALQKSVDMVTQPLDQMVVLAIQQILYLIEHPETEPKDYLIKGSFRKRLYKPFVSPS